MTEPFHFRLATPDDRELVGRISSEAYVPAYEPLGFVPFPAIEDYGPRITGGQVWLLEGVEAIAVGVFERHEAYLMIYSIAVLPSHKGMGHGHRLLAFADELARGWALREVRLYTNTRMHENIAHYEKCGFRKLGVRPHPTRAGETLIDMIRISETIPGGKINL